jgi:hypothetical protein
MDEIFDKQTSRIDYFYVKEWMQDPTDFHQTIEGYDIVFIIQLISMNILEKIKCDNILFMPMYDGCYSWDTYKWLECANLKIISPVKKTYEELRDMGLNAYYGKYYPKPFDFMPGDVRKIFLWQRVNQISINTVQKLFENHPPSQIHLHNVPDPFQTSSMPATEAIKTHNITLSNWFEDKKAYLDLLQDKGIYMAPRTKEGGAAAFIDGMKMGKLVIAHNDAPMNEYIVHGETGLLYDVDSVSPLDLDAFDLMQIQKNAYQSVVEGREAWLESIPKMRNFIESKNHFSFSNKTLRNIREEHTSSQKINALLVQEKTRLETEKSKMENQNASLKDNHWYRFGQLSRKRKMLKLITVLAKQLHVYLLLKRVKCVFEGLFLNRGY